LVLNADISDETIFEEEDLGSRDLMVAVTDNQELNMLASLYAKIMGVKRTIALVTNAGYLSIASRLDIDVAISPKNSTVDAIMKYIRRGNIKSLHSIFGGKAEVIEFLANEKSGMVGRRLRDLEFPKQSLILSVVRGEKNILPHGNMAVEPGDLVLMVAAKDSIAEIERFIQD
ncbi:MAG TPA: TrkA C-terminal domain-containing protein, partial [Spirochaetota bacterium]|nr:TrkA C-terminal domain-containing protein [Spirochaetota bacterium]